MSIPTESFPPQSNKPAVNNLRPATERAGNLPSPNTRAGNDDIAPLGVPALVLGVMLAGAGFAALLKVRSWSRDYGCLVYVAYILYISLAGSLSVWGFRLTGSANVPNPQAIRDQTSLANTGGRSERSRSRTAPRNRSDLYATPRAAG
ncbi:hypothetical protein [Nocardia sp. NPDC050793]|uniref:hypothetical protein n=1 Tax=Nocardia sp. NPDC050793 TaxID=3155159 RepID=UPI0033C3F507